MYSDILCAVTLKDESISDLLGSSQELDVTSLKDDADAMLSEEEQQLAAQFQARLAEIATIQEFIAKKKAYEAANPRRVQEKEPVVVAKKKHAGGRGRPRQSFIKVVTFTVVDTNKFKLAGRGRPGKAERVKFTLHHTQAAQLDPSAVYTLKALEAMAVACTK